MPTNTKTKTDTPNTQGTISITTKSIEINISGYDLDRLQKEHVKNLERIKAIQGEVSGEYDNLNNPSVPLFQQLS